MSTKLSNFNNNLEKLSDIVERLEQGDLSLEDSLKAFEEGIKLTTSAQQALDKAEQNVQLLLNSGEEPGFEPVEENKE